MFLIILPLSSPAIADSGSDKILKADLIFGPDENLDPAYKYTGWYMHEAGIYETLYSLDQDMNLVPTLATGYDQVSDTEYRIRWREGVKFHAGSPLEVPSPQAGELSHGQDSPVCSPFSQLFRFVFQNR